MKLAFYAPMKSPNHPVPSGDRRMGRLLWQALEKAGFELDLASDFRSFDKSGDPELHQLNKQKGAAEAERLLTKWQASPAEAPQGWFTYHLYHKAPDWIGPIVSAALDIPYFIAEASHAPKRATGPWQMGYDAAAEAIRSAAAVFHMTTLDGACLGAVVEDKSKLVFLPPFLDVSAFLAAADWTIDVAAEIKKAGGQQDKQNLLSVAMMRDGDKLQSYRQLGTALAMLKNDDWQLLVIGDGEQRRTVEQLLAPLADKAVFLGIRPAEQLPVFYDAADLYVWPAHGEAYGMAFLEAQSCGLPVVAGNIRGVPDVVHDQITGLLTPEGDFPAFAAGIGELLGDMQRRQKMAAAAREFVAEERGISGVVDILKNRIEACR
ncbi:MAG: glycosyl transferase family 1 [Sneathiella sp.]|nr:MAG: glycosyl transferase family 1 [Sneathiella sp.]